MLVYDAWRHIIFLSAGEVDEQWIAGIIGVCGDDLRGSKLDNRLRNELRIIELLDVRLLMERAAPAKKRKYSRIGTWHRLRSLIVWFGPGAGACVMHHFGCAIDWPLADAWVVSRQLRVATHMGW